MARTCKQCGEKLFTTDTFCGFCGATVEDASGAMESFSYAPRSLVGNDALSKNEREEIERAKKKYMSETAAAMAEEAQIAQLKEKEQALRLEAEKKAAEAKAAEEAAKREKLRISAEQLRMKKEELLAAKAASERAAEEAVRIEAAKKAAEEAARIEAEKRAAEEAVRIEVEKKAAEEAVRIEAENKETEKALSVEIEAVEDSGKSEVEEVSESASEAVGELEWEAVGGIETEAASESESEEIDESETEETGEGLGNTDEDEISELGEESDDEDSLGLDNWELESGYDESEDVEEAYAPVKVTSTTKMNDDSEVWLAAEKRARAEQREADKIKRRNGINGRKNTLTRDIVLLSIGIIFLVIVLVFLVKSELNGLTGNDKNHEKLPVATEEGALSEGEFPADMGLTWDGSVATKFYQGDGSAANPYLISSGSELAYLASEVNRGVNFSEVYFSLSEDINLGGLEWTPIGYYYKNEAGEDLVYSFNGSFEGNNHVISNYKITTLATAILLPNYSDNKVCGLFGATHGAKLSNININNCTMEPIPGSEGEILAGALVGCAYDTDISGCNIAANINISCEETNSFRVVAGTVAGATSNGSIKSVTATGDISVYSGMGVNDTGIVTGYSKGTEFADLNVTGTATAKAGANVYCGGVNGYSSEIKVNNAYVNATIVSEVTNTEAKLLSGMLSGYQSGCEDTGAELTGTLTAKGIGTVYAGGSCGYAENSTSAQVTANVVVDAASTGNGVMLMAGGVYGMSTDTTLDGTTVSGSVTSVAAEVNYVGGITGLATGGGISNVSCDAVVNGQATATETAHVMAGGATGNITDVTLSGLTLTGSVTVNSTVDGYVGGASGYINGGSYVNVAASGALVNSSTTGVCTGGFAGYAAGAYTSEGCSGSTDRTNTGKNVYDEDFIGIVEE